MSKLFKVTVEFDYVLQAESEREANILAFQYASDALHDCSESVVDISVEDYTPGSVYGWTEDIEPYGKK